MYKLCNIPKPRRATHTVTFSITAVWELMHEKRKQQDGDGVKRYAMWEYGRVSKKDSVGVI